MTRPSLPLIPMPTWPRTCEPLPPSGQTLGWWARSLSTLVRRTPPKHALQRGVTTTVVRKVTRKNGARNCQSSDTNYPSAYHTSPQLSIQGVLTRYRSTLLMESSPSVQVRIGHDYNAASTIAVVAAPVPESIETGNFRPRNSGSVHPFFHTLPRALVCPQVGFFVVFTKGL